MSADISATDKIALLITTAAKDVTNNNFSPTLRGSTRSNDVTPRKSSLATPRSLSNSYSGLLFTHLLRYIINDGNTLPIQISLVCLHLNAGKKRAVSFNASNSFLAASVALEDRVDLYPAEPDNVNQTITQCSIPEEEETSVRSRMSFAHLDQSSLKVEELHTSEKFFSVDDLFSKLMTIQQSPDPDPEPELSKHELSSIPLDLLPTTSKFDSEKGSDCSSSIKLEPYVIEQHVHEPTTDIKPTTNTKPLLKEPKPTKSCSFESLEAYEPSPVITTIEVIQHSAGVLCSTKSDASIFSDTTGNLPSRFNFYRLKLFESSNTPCYAIVLIDQITGTFYYLYFLSFLISHYKFHLMPNHSHHLTSFSSC